MRPPGTGDLQLHVTTEITRALAATIERAIDDYPSYSVEVVCDTIGGDWNASRRIFECLVAHDKRVSAQISRAQSGGALIVMAADIRRMSPAGTFFLHWPRGDVAQARLDEIAATKAGLIASRSRVPVATLLRWMRDNTWLDAEQALRYGLATEVPGMKSPSTVTVFL